MTWSSDTSPAGAGPRARKSGARLRQSRRLVNPPRVQRKRPRREGEAQEAVRRRGVEVQAERRQHGADEAVEWAGDRVESRSRPHAPRVECARGQLHALAALDMRLDLPERAVGQPEREAVARAALEVEP